MTSVSKTEMDLKEVLNSFKRITGFAEVEHEIKERPDGAYLIIYLLLPSERFFELLGDVLKSIPDTNCFFDRVTIKRRLKSVSNRLALPETMLLRKVLSESLTVSSTTFEDNFLSRYTRSVFGAEEQVITKSNHIVFGRRGAGKSMLLQYCSHILKKEGIPCVWIPMQTYDGSNDFASVIDVFVEVLNQLKVVHPSPHEIDSLKQKLDEIPSDDNAEAAFDRLLPKIRRILAALSSVCEYSVIFLDDIHVLKESLQPIVLQKLYALARGNRIFLKISGIEYLTKIWDPALRKGLETPHDAQSIALDYNLTMPDKSSAHIDSILNSHARYCGLPDIRYLCGENVLSRLVWVAAGVPRDALSIFSDAIARATLKSQRLVSIASINEAASETADEKLSDINKDASGKLAEVKDTFSIVRKFCKDEKKTNAFLVEIGTASPRFKTIEELIALRLLHVVHEGVTPHEAGRRYIALMLDFGFYVGIRAARSVDLFQKKPAPIAAKSVRNLPIFPLAQLA